MNNELQKVMVMMTIAIMMTMRTINKRKESSQTVVNASPATRNHFLYPKFLQPMEE